MCACIGRALWPCLTLDQHVSWFGHRYSQLQVSTTMREAVRWLRKRPEWLKYVNIETRNPSQLTSLFLLRIPRFSLAQHSHRPSLQPSLVGDPLVLLDPSSLHTHDLRYIGDMLTMYGSSTWIPSILPILLISMTAGPYDHYTMQQKKVEFGSRWEQIPWETQNLVWCSFTGPVSLVLYFICSMLKSHLVIVHQC